MPITSWDSTRSGGSTIVQGGPIPFYANAEAWETLRKTFFYVFDGRAASGRRHSQDRFARDVDGPFTVGGVRVIPVPLWHGRLPILGFRFGSFAYLTDCNRIPDESWPLLRGVDTLVLDALRDKPHATHFSLSEAVEVARTIARAADVLHAHGARPRPRRDQRAPACRRGAGL